MIAFTEPAAAKAEVCVEIVQVPESPSKNASASFFYGTLVGLLAAHLINLGWVWFLGIYFPVSLTASHLLERRAERRARMLVRVTPIKPEAAKEVA